MCPARRVSPKEGVGKGGLLPAASPRRHPHSHQARQELPHMPRDGEDHLVTFPSPGDLQQHARVPDTSMYPPCTSLHSWQAPCSLLPRQQEPTQAKLE